MGRELSHQTSEPGWNSSWDAMVHPVCETFNVMRVVRGLTIKYPEFFSPQRMAALIGTKQSGIM